MIASSKSVPEEDGDLEEEEEEEFVIKKEQPLHPKGSFHLCMSNYLVFYHYHPVVAFYIKRCFFIQVICQLKLMKTSVIRSQILHAQSTQQQSSVGGARSMTGKFCDGYKIKNAYELVILSKF